MELGKTWLLNLKEDRVSWEKGPLQILALPRHQVKAVIKYLTYFFLPLFGLLKLSLTRPAGNLNTRVTTDLSHTGYFGSENCGE